jgi:regulator of protease activity HflC (stomatin/prohibitin superfamily)
MANLIDEKLANLKAEAEAELVKINRQIEGNAQAAIILQDKKAEIEAMLAEFVTSYPAITAKPAILKTR